MEIIDINSVLNLLKNWVPSVLLGVLFFMASSLGRKVLLRRFGPERIIHKMMMHSPVVMFFLFSVGVGLFFHSQNHRINYGVEKFLFLIAMLQFAIWSNTLVSFLTENYRQAKMAEDVASVTTLNVMSSLIKFGIYSTLTMITLSHFGINITALVAGFGLGGFAFGVAFQSIIADFLGSVAIFVEKPFVVGETISINNCLGDVERIGLKSTLIKRFSGERVLVPNSEFLRSHIHNFKRMDQRRMSFSIAVNHQTPHAVLQKLSGWLRQAVLQQNGAKLERCVFKSFSLHGIEYEVMFWSLDPDMNSSLAVTELIMLSILKTLAREGVELAFLQGVIALPSEV